MIFREMSMQIRYLDRQGVTRAEIAQRLGVSRQTVYNHLQQRGSPPRPEVLKPSKLDPFKPYIRNRLALFDLKATVLLEELRPLGYSGGITILRRFIRPLKAEFVRRVTERFETLPGQQAQMDWGECGHIRVDGAIKTLYVFVLVLGYSRMMDAQFTCSCRLPVLLSCLKRAFQRLGIPQEVLVDNMKQAVESHDVSTGMVHWNPTFLDFAQHYEFLPVACPPYWPQVKGKVERGVGYIKSSFLEGRSFSELDELNHQLDGWLDRVANVRIHGTTRQRPIDRHGQELAHLRSFCGAPFYDTRPVEMRKVPSDSHVSYQGVRYSVHPDGVGHTVILRPDGEQVGAAFSIYLGDRLLGRHFRRPAGSGPVTLAEHAQAIRQASRYPSRPAAGRKKRQPHFIQLEGKVAPVCFPAFQDLAPPVEVRPLSSYDSLLEEDPS
jgi:transposase